MQRTLQFTAVIKKSGDRYIANCPQLDFNAEGETVDQAVNNLHAIVKSFFDTASNDQIQARQQLEVYISRLEIEIN